MELPSFEKLTRNPLGIIGLFIWLIYSIAGLVFATSSAAHPYSIQLALTAFIVTFPFAILSAFLYLVIKHHQKLYAPGDFKDERLFFRPATAAEVQEKQTLETSQVESIELAPDLNVAPPDLSPSASDYLSVETSALKHVERMFNKPISRDVVTEVDGKRLIFDGVYEDAKRIDLFEVKIYRKPKFKREFLEAVLYRATSVRLHEAVSKRDREFRLWLVIVTEFEGDALADFEQRMKDSVDTNNFMVKWVFLRRSQLA